MTLVDDPAVRLTRVTHRYGTGAIAVRALTGINLQLEKGSSVALVGPSGSGKSTLLNLVGGLDRPSEGELEVLGSRLDLLSEKALTVFRARNVGIVFQEPHLLPGLTALENVVAGRLPWARWSVLAPQANELLTSVGLGGRLHHSPSQLSGGERQRVAIARALLGEPLLLLADEPTGNLDSKTTDEVLDLLARLRQHRGFTFVVATHDPAVAAVATRVIHLTDGRIVADERPSRSILRVQNLE